MIIFQKADFQVVADTGEIAGYASKYNGVDSYGDTILPGAYDDILTAGILPKMFFNHRTGEVPFGDWLEMEGRPDGLYVKGRLDLSIPAAKEVYHAIKAGRVDGLSVSIEVADGGYEQKDPDDWWSGYNISKVSALREVSICSFPADNSARIASVKAEDLAGIRTIRDIEKTLRDAGFSKKAAGAFIAASRAVYHRENAEKAQRDAREMRLAELSAKIHNITEILKNG